MTLSAKDVRRVTVVEGGPVLVEGPVDIALGDGSYVRSERPVVAVCVCRRSKRFPFCDTSHRQRRWLDAQPVVDSDARSEE